MFEFIFGLCIAAGLVLFFLERLYHGKERLEIASLVGVNDIAKAKRDFKKYRSQPLDVVLGPLQFLGNWLIIIGMIGTAYRFNYLAFDLLTVWVICAQLRALEELSHMAIHGAVGGSKSFQLLVADFFFQLPALKNSARERRHRHCSLHHPNVNLLNKDPGLQDFVEIGFVPGISRTKFWLCVFHPLTPLGVFQRLRGVMFNLTSDFRSPFRLGVRAVTIATTVVPFYLLDWGYGFGLFYILPLIIFFPQFYWFSQVAEHRWFENVDGLDKLQRELLSGRPTLYKGVLGQFVRYSFFPVGDSHHLAHSLFPYMRWSYLGEIDRLLILNIPEYSQHTSKGLFIGSVNRPSALDYLREKLIRTPV